MFSINKIYGKIDIPFFSDEPDTPGVPIKENESSDNPSAFEKLNEAHSAYGRAFVQATNPLKAEKSQRNTASKIKYTPKQIEIILKNFLKNDEYEIHQFQSVFSNLDKIDYENIEVHLENLKIFMGGPSNSKEQIFENGYFASKEGAEAFEALLEILSTKAERGRISPFNIALSDYRVEDVLILKRRGLLTSENVVNSQRLNKLAQMSDEEFDDYFKRAKESIEKTGLTFDELRSKAIKEIKNTCDGYCARMLVENAVNEESVVAQLEILEVIKKYPIKFSNSHIYTILNYIDMDNSKYCKNMLLNLAKRSDITSDAAVDIALLANEENEKILTDLIEIKDVPLEKIIKHLPNADKISKEEILNNINNDPYVKTSRKIKQLDVDLKPKNVEPKPLDARNINENALALVHMTKYEPKDGVILSTRDKLGGSRNSVHFTLNHPVTSHRGGDWDGCNYAIIMPYTAVKKLNGDDKFIEGMPNDLYTNGSVKIPEGSIIVKQNSKLENGDVKISEHPTIKGVKVLETVLLPHEITPSVIEKMGYTHLEADGPVGLFSYGKNNGRDIDDAVKNFNAWSDFCKTQNIMPTRHTGSAADVAEKLIEDIGSLAWPNTWVLGEGDKNSVDYKKRILKTIEVVKKWTQKGYFVSYDLDKLKNIVENSSTPKLALDAIQKELGFHPTIKYNYCNQYMLDIPLQLYEKWVYGVDKPDELKEMLLDEMRHDL